MKDEWPLQINLELQNNPKKQNWNKTGLNGQLETTHSSLDMPLICRPKLVFSDWKKKKNKDSSHHPCSHLHSLLVPSIHIIWSTITNIHNHGPSFVLVLASMISSVTFGTHFSIIRSNKNEFLGGRISLSTKLSRTSQGSKLKNYSYHTSETAYLGVRVTRASSEMVEDRVVEKVGSGRALRVGVICGGPSAERGISLNSARSVLDHIQVRKLAVSTLKCSKRCWRSNWLENVFY